MAATRVDQPTLNLIAHLAQAQIDTSRTTELQFQSVSNLVARVKREAALRHNQFEERTSNLEANLNETNIKFAEFGDRTENELGDLKQQVEAVNFKLDNVMTTVQNVLVAPNSTAVAVRPKPKTKCSYCFKFLVDIRRHIKEQCHYAPEEDQLSVAPRLRSRVMEKCVHCGGRFEKQKLARHRNTCARRQNVGADIIGIIDTDPLGGDSDTECAPVLEMEILS